MVIPCWDWSQDKLAESLEEPTLSASKAESLMYDYNYYLLLTPQ